MATHLAAVLTAKGQPLEVQSRASPTPGPDDLLIDVKAIALNPADHIIRDLGLFMPSYPTVIGFDLAGVVLAVGDNVPTSETATDDDETLCFRPGLTRVAAYAAFAWKADADYGAFQEKVLVPWQHAIILPNSDARMSWSAAATLPVAIQVPLSMWDAMGIARITDFPVFSNAGVQAKPKVKNEALLVWGASSSVGSMGVQTARMLRDDPTSAIAAVYATASKPNHAYVTSLGADLVFDYRDEDIVQAIVDAAQRQELVIKHCFLAMGEIGLCQAVLKTFVDTEGVSKRNSTSKIASAPPIPAEAAKEEGMEALFVQPSYDEGERREQFRYWLTVFARQALTQGKIRPSPDPTVVGRGLEAINCGLEKLLGGVSCTKLVIELL